MKTIFYQVIIILAVGYACGAASTEAMPQWRATVKVVDEASQPVQGANVTIGYYVPPPASRPTSIATDAKRGVTDTNGVYAASEHSRSPDLFVGVTKDGYYKTHVDYELGPEYSPARWTPELTLVLKRIGRPIPMYAKWIRQGPPVFNQPVGYDLMAGDWVVPNCKGQTTDILFTHVRDQKSPLDYEYTLKVTFPKPGDGIQEFAVPAEQSGSGLRLPHEAPENGYQAELARVNVSHPLETAQMDYNPKRNYFFRVRTVLDEHGNVKSALYGKIYGDFMHLRYYLNPTPNDRNVEFDPRRNLLRGLRGSQIVDAP